MRKPGGYFIAADPYGPAIEHDTFTCHHCNRVIFVNAFQDPTERGGCCPRCVRLICKDCVNVAMRGKTCDPWEEKMARMEARYMFLRDAGLT